MNSFNRRNPNNENEGLIAGFTLLCVYSCRDGELGASDLLLPMNRATISHVKSLRTQAESDQELFRAARDGDLASARMESPPLAFGKSIEKSDVEAEVREIVQSDEAGPLLTAGFSHHLAPCVFREDVMAQKKAADGNMKFGDRDRTNSVKAVTKALLARPMTRKIVIPQDVDAAMRKLFEVAPHIPELVESLRVPLMVAVATGAPPMIPPLLLVGPAGVGKSFVALRIAEILGVPVRTVSYAASGGAGNVLSGADKNWGNSSTGIVFDLLTEGEFANPVICLDEIDKASVSGSTHGPDRNPLNELLALLEPVTASEHKDRCAEIRVDARHIVWIATANSLEGLSAPLLSRFKLVMVRRPDARAAVMIALSAAQAVNTQMGVTLKAPSGEVLQFLSTLTPRVMRRIWTGAAGWATYSHRDRVTMKDLEQSLGLHASVDALMH